MAIELLTDEHFKGFQFRPQELRKFEADPSAMEKTAALIKYGKAAVLKKDNLVIAIFGYYEMWPGVIEVWSFPSIYVQKYAMLYLRTMKRYVRVLGRTLPIHRMQTTSVDDDLHNRWMRFLEFTNETPNGMSKYSVVQERYNLWAKTYEDRPDE